MASIGDVFRIGLQINNELVGCVMVGRPVSRHLDDGTTLEVNRNCVLPERKNACSKLYGAALRAGKALGYTKIITYTLQFESGSSLRAVGFLPETEIKGKVWDRVIRHRIQKSLWQEYDKIRWVKLL